MTTTVQQYPGEGPIIWKRNWANRVASTDTIASVAHTATPAGLTLANSTNVLYETQVSVTTPVAGDGTIYTITETVTTTTSAETIKREWYLDCTELSE